MTTGYSHIGFSPSFQTGQPSPEVSLSKIVLFINFNTSKCYIIVIVIFMNLYVISTFILSRASFA